MHLTALQPTELPAPASGVRAAGTRTEARLGVSDLDSARGARLEALAEAASLALTALARVRYQATWEEFFVFGLALPCCPSLLSEAILSTAEPESMSAVLSGLVTELVGHYDDLAKGHALCRVLDGPSPRARRALGDPAALHRATVAWR